MIIQKIKSSKGVTLAELLIAAFITGIIAVAAFDFYAKMHVQSETQSEVSDIQLVCRNSLLDMKKMARMAGFKVGAHKAYEISGDTLSLYMNGSQPVDTIQYFLMPMSDSGAVDPAARPVYWLMKKVNSGSPEIYADYLKRISYSTPDSTTMIISITAESAHQDLDYHNNNGYHSYTLTEKVKLRNLL
jgi:hypothetical protein